ncbi:glycoside hydrolase family 5 protein [Agarivorans sp. TSD2052]|uniref:glycoside hydrolase family 5 protein n=1 Tax=Agarivorans sp. TSD2052 TaxID=2937286 RepID=UPI00200ED68E|nr:cellulase family glycosylhydrolase [Agarivorans sp. TSD2052]UPW20567.1 glycoside hydrolase family 5 protein [Agarivorans sp. TSD2052]
MAIIFGLLSTAAMANFVDTKGTSIVDEHGQTLFLKGINLGNWLLWEGYLMMGDYQYRTHTQLFNSLTTVFGSEAKAREFEHQWRLHYVDDQALKALRQLGFNSVRVPFHYRLFWQDGQLTDRGFEYFDRLIQSAGKHGIYVLLDMHAAPGYQNPGAHADNLQSNASQPRDSVGFWDNSENIEIAAKVWRHIALRYKDEPVIWGYDLLNEPVPQHGRELELLSSLITLRNAIREVDTQHIIVAQGSWWGSDLTKLDWTDPKVQQASGVTEQWDNKLVYQLHHYGPAADTIGREAITNKLNVPLIIGEYGESNNANIAKITAWAKQDLAGYFAWSFKKMSHDKTLWTIPPNSAYQQLKHHINTAQPGSDDLYQAMLHFAQSNIKNGHPALQWHGDFYQAIYPSLTAE